MRYGLGLLLIPLMTSLAAAEPLYNGLNASQAKALIDKLSSPKGAWNEISISTKVLTIASDDLLNTVEAQERDFWANCGYKQMFPDLTVDYEHVSRMAYQNGGILVYREIGDGAVQTFLSTFVSTAEQDQATHRHLASDLPQEEAFAVGYDDGLSEHFGDGMFIFQFFTDKTDKSGRSQSDLLVVNVNFAQT